jgi:hypothetical protein
MIVTVFKFCPWPETGSVCNCLTDDRAFQLLCASVSSRHTLSASGIAASAFCLSSRRNCWLTLAGDFIFSFSASHSCDTNPPPPQQVRQQHLPRVRSLHPPQFTPLQTRSLQTLGPPFAQAIIDSVNTLNPGDNTTASVSFDGSNVRFTFGIPRGNDGTNGTNGNDGGQGPPGEVTNAQLSSAISGTSNNTNAIATLDTPFADPDAESMRQRFNELVLALRR